MSPNKYLSLLCVVSLAVSGLVMEPLGDEQGALRPDRVELAGAAREGDPLRISAQHLLRSRAHGEQKLAGLSPLF